MSKIYDLEDRTENFARDCRRFTRQIFKDIPNKEDSKQLVRSSGSVAANYIEANEALSKKDFVYRIKVSRKEAKESRLWLKLIVTSDSEFNKLQKELIQESTELIKILTTIISKSE
jgi:four helix bundle protein